jgi:hypothetical protein
MLVSQHWDNAPEYLKRVSLFMMSFKNFDGHECLCCSCICYHSDHSSSAYPLGGAHTFTFAASAPIVLKDSKMSNASFSLHCGDIDCHQCSVSMYLFCSFDSLPYLTPPPFFFFQYLVSSSFLLFLLLLLPSITQFQPKSNTHVLASRSSTPTTLYCMRLTGFSVCFAQHVSVCFEYRDCCITFVIHLDCDFFSCPLQSIVFSVHSLSSFPFFSCH